MIFRKLELLLHWFIALLRRWTAKLPGRPTPALAPPESEESPAPAEAAAPVPPAPVDPARVRAASTLVARQTDATLREESRRLGPLLAEILGEARSRMVPGATTQDLADALVRGCQRRDLEPALLGYHGFPAPVAIAVNDEIVHGIPSSRVLSAGDLVKVELAVVSGLAFAGQSWTFPVGPATPADDILLVEGRRALRAAIDVVSMKSHVGDLGAAIQSVVEGAGLSVVRAFVGYGMGQSRIQPPQLRGVGSPGSGELLRPGAILNLHVLLKHGSPEVRTADNRWTALAADGRRAALFTAMVQVTLGAPIELTRFLDP